MTHSAEWNPLVAMLPRWRRRALGTLRTRFVVPRNEPASKALAAAGMAPEPDACIDAEDLVRLLRALVAAGDAGELRGEDRHVVANNARAMLDELGADTVGTIACTAISASEVQR